MPSPAHSVRLILFYYCYNMLTRTRLHPQALHLSLNKDLVPSLMRKVYGGAVEGLEEDLEVAADVVQVGNGPIQQTDT